MVSLSQMRKATLEEKVYYTLNRQKIIFYSLVIENIAYKLSQIVKMYNSR